MSAAASCSRTSNCTAVTTTHLFPPTGLLQCWHADASPGPGGDWLLADFAGGVVRVEESSSSVLNGFYPGEV